MQTLLTPWPYHVCWCLGYLRNQAIKRRVIDHAENQVLAFLHDELPMVVVFRKGTRISQERWFYGETLIPVCSRIPYLGLVFSSNGSYSRTQSTLADQANKAIFQLHKILLRFKGITVSAALDLFDKLITPILRYGCEVWGFHSAPDIERVHLSFCKRILCVKKYSQNAFVCGLLGRFPLELNR